MPAEDASPAAELYADMLSRMRALGWQSSVSLADGIRRTYESAREILLAGVV